MINLRSLSGTALGLMALTLGGCLSSNDLAERTAMQEAGLLRQDPDHKSRGSFARIYTYYPDAQMYYSSFQDKYYWQEEGDWRRSTQAPTHLDLDQARAELITLYENRPYVEHEEVLAMHPPNTMSEIDQAWVEVPTDY